MIYIFDIDGTLANITHRLHFIGASEGTSTEKGLFVPTTDTTKDWAGFFKAAVDDTPIFEVITVARALAVAGHTIVYSTGRSTSISTVTYEWLGKYRLPQYSHLYMRTEGDHREDCVVKSELLDKIMHEYGEGLGGYGGVFDDRQQVVDMYRARGLRVFQVAKGDF